MGWKLGDDSCASTIPRALVVILGHVQNPSKVERLEDLAQALEDWMSKKKQHEEFTDSDGTPAECQKIH